MPSSSYLLPDSNKNTVLFSPKDNQTTSVKAQTRKRKQKVDRKKHYWLTVGGHPTTVLREWAFGFQQALVHPRPGNVPANAPHLYSASIFKNTFVFTPLFYPSKNNFLLSTRSNGNLCWTISKPFPHILSHMNLQNHDHCCWFVYLFCCCTSNNIQIAKWLNVSSHSMSK